MKLHKVAYQALMLSIFNWRISDDDFQRIRRILHYSHLPYLNAFTLEAINHQRLFHQGCCVLDNFNDDHNVPEKLTYPLKPSRYKGDITFPYLAKILVIKLNGHIFLKHKSLDFILCNFFLILAFRTSPIEPLGHPQW